MFKVHDTSRICFWCPCRLFYIKSKYFLNFITSDRLYKIVDCHKIYPSQFMSKSICFSNIFSIILLIGRTHSPGRPVITTVLTTQENWHSLCTPLKYKACSKKDRTFDIKTLVYKILSTVPFKVVPSTGDTPFPSFLSLLECFLERTSCDGAQFSYRIFLNLLVLKKWLFK
jgi:hypothetical protein